MVRVTLPDGSVKEFEGPASALASAEASGSRPAKAAAGAKVQIGKAGRYVGQQAVQLHGGMGMTDELNVGHYFKRLTMIDTQFGNIDYQLKRYSEAA